MTETLGPYSLIAELSLSETAEIFLGLHNDGSAVALKAVLGRDVGDTFKEQHLLDEGATTAQLRHPNIVSVHEHGSDNGRTYLVMNYVHGRDLGALLHRLREVDGTVALEVAAFVTRDVAAALNFIHSSRTSGGQPLNLAHGDLSPQNIMLGLSGDVVVIDLQTPGRAPQSMLGPYIAPECVQGQQPDARSDMFALGSCLYELMTGRQANDLDVVHEQLANPSGTDLPPELLAVAAKSLSPSPDDRFQKASEMYDALAEYLDTHSAGFSRGHLAAYLSRLFEKLEILPPALPAQAPQAPPVSMGAPLSNPTVPNPDMGDYEDPALAPSGPIGGPLDDATGPMEIPPTHVSQDTKIEPATQASARSIPERIANARTDEIQLSGGGPDLGRITRPPSADIKLPRAPSLLTQSGFNRFIQPKVDNEDSQAQVDESIVMKRPALQRLKRLSKGPDTDQSKTQPVRASDIPEIAAYEKNLPEIEVEFEALEPLPEETAPMSGTLPSDARTSAVPIPLAAPSAFGTPPSREETAVPAQTEPAAMNAVMPDDATAAVPIPMEHLPAQPQLDIQGAHDIVPDAPTAPAAQALSHPMAANHSPTPAEIPLSNAPAPFDGPYDPPTEPIQIPTASDLVATSAATHPMTGAPISADDPDASSGFSTSMGLGGIDASGTFRASAHLMGSDPASGQSASLQVPRDFGQSSSDSSGGIPSNLGADMSGTFRAAGADISGMGPASASGEFRAAPNPGHSSPNEGKFANFDTKTIAVAALFFAILIGLVIFVMSLPD